MKKENNLFYHFALKLLGACWVFCVSFQRDSSFRNIKIWYFVKSLAISMESLKDLLVLENFNLTKIFSQNKVLDFLFISFTTEHVEAD